MAEIRPQVRDGLSSKWKGETEHKAVRTHFGDTEDTPRPLSSTQVLTDKATDKILGVHIIGPNVMRRRISFLGGRHSHHSPAS